MPLTDADPRGFGLAASAFPITFGGILISLLIAGPMRRLWAVVGYAAVAGFALTAVLQGWFGALQGDFVLNALATGVTILAISAPIVGTASLFGRAGIAFGPIVFLLFANPISSATSPVEALPGRSARQRQGADAIRLRVSPLRTANDAKGWPHAE